MRRAKTTAASNSGSFATQTRGEAEGVSLYFHVAPEDAHNSIVSEGIDHTRGESQYEHLDFPRGNYLFTDAGAAEEYAEIRTDEDRAEYGVFSPGYRVYEVTHDGPVHQDPFHDDESGLGRYSVYTPDPIPVDSIRQPAGEDQRPAVADRIMRHFGYDGMPAEVDYEDPRIDYSLPQDEIDAVIDSLSLTSEQWRDSERAEAVAQFITDQGEGADERDVARFAYSYDMLDDSFAYADDETRRRYLALARAGLSQAPRPASWIPVVDLLALDDMEPGEVRTLNDVEANWIVDHGHSAEHDSPLAGLDEHLEQSKISAYADRSDLPPILVTLPPVGEREDGPTLIDGHHRLFAAVRSGLPVPQVEFHAPVVDDDGDVDYPTLPRRFGGLA